jgi:hypothetical protein
MKERNERKGKLLEQNRGKTHNIKLGSYTLAMT